ncbi:Gfo/Idh/MocA family protein [Georgenia sp. AZ-5]|uniref:Gfo/Idh/MocA family protein n=1 Tax=Georgenia sp. AZ-5 TaxID=3367526 RepID=UPI003754676E
MKLGIVGCGRIYRNHVQAARLVEGVELVGFADIDKEHLRAAVEQWGLPGFTDYQELVDAGAEAVSLCLPHSMHADVCVDLAQRGVHVLCEKPLATTLQDADRMIEACDAAGVQLGVVFQHRFNDNSVILRRLIEAGELGDLVLGTAIFQYHKAPSDAAYFAWRGSVQGAGGGTLANFGVHTIDLLLWLMGAVSDARGYVATLTMGTEVEDTGAAVLKFESGALGTIAATLASSVDFESRLCIAGTEATAWLTDSSRLEVRRIDGRRETHEFEGLLDDPAFPTKAPYGRGHIAVLADFAAAVREGRPPACDGRSARRTQAVIASIYEQQRLGRAERAPV